MAGLNREDWKDLNVTQEELETLTQAMKKEEFRKLLAEYAEEITDPKNRKQYQDEIVQLEAERGVDCTFVNPEPGFVVKTSVDGNKKAFVNICKNPAVGRPIYKRELKEGAPGVSWSIPMCQTPKRDDFDKKKNRCSVYDVVFHPDTLCLTEKSVEFKKLVIDTALNAVEDCHKVKLDKKNIKLPKLKYKGMPMATVIRKKSKTPPTLTEEEIEFQNTIKYPFKPPTETEPIVKNFETKKEELKQKYTIPKYVIKHSSNIDLQEFTYDKRAKINSAIPKELVIEVNLPLLNSTNTVTLDIMEKSLHLICEKPVKYKLDLQLPYKVNEEIGSAKFDKDRRLLIIKLPVIKARLTFKDLMREDSGVESDSSPVGSISSNDFDNIQGISADLEESNQTNDEGVPAEEDRLSSDESEKDHTTRKNEEEFLDSDKHYLLPAFSCNLDVDKICFVLNVKNVDPDSLVKKSLNSNACYVKFYSIGSGFFPVHYAFLVDFKHEANIEKVTYDVWDNNVTVLIDLVKNDQAIIKYHVGLTEDSLVEYFLNQPLELKKVMEEIYTKAKEEENKEESNLNVNVQSADLDEVVISIIPEKPEDFEGDDKDVEVLVSSAPSALNIDSTAENKTRTLSESNADEFIPCPLVRKSILKKRIHRSLSESNADDYAFSSSAEKCVSDLSDLCENDENIQTSQIKKTVRFNDHIREQLFRINSSILGQRKKNRKKSKNKRKALAKRLSESENSEGEDKEGDKKTKKSKQCKKCKNSSLIEIVTNKEEKENQNASQSLEDETKKTVEEKKEAEEEKPKFGTKKDAKILEFKSDLIFDLDM